MWERRKPEPPESGPFQQQPQPLAPVASPAQAASAPALAPAAPTRSDPSSRSGATIGKAVRVVGDIYSQEDLFVDGEVQGLLNVEGARLTIGPNGKAMSEIKAREVVIQGKVQGNVEAVQKLTIKKEGSLVGNIKTTGIIIEDDAYFKGSIDIIRNGN
jgi:cytoskeletal protein CcmA (bactofilin family)